MTIKNTRKDIASEPGSVVLGINKTYDTNSSEIDDMNLTVGTDNQNYNEIFDNEDNYNGDLVIKLKKQDQYTERPDGSDKSVAVSSAQADKIVIPLSKLVTKKHLYEYFKARFIDIKINVIGSTDDLPDVNDNRYGDPSYLFLVFYDNVENNKSTYKQYVWDSEDEEYKRIRDIEIVLPDILRKTDVVNNLNTSVSNKPLSAAQGEILYDLISNINSIQTQILSML